VTDAKSFAASSELAERSLAVKGRTIRYFVGGAGSPLVLVHGLGGSAVNWAELAPLLTPHFRVVIPDLPGHGASEPLAGVSGLQPYADRVAAVMEREGAAPAPLMGHSLGGLVVLRLALRRPDTASAVVLAAAAGLSIGGIWGRNLLTAVTVVRPGRLAGRYRSLIARSPILRRIVFGVVSVADPVGLSDLSVDGFLAGQVLHTDTGSAWRALRDDDPRQELERLRQPALVLWGADDVQLPLDDAFEYARRLRAPLRVIAGCGHLLIGERPAPCADAVREFLVSGDSRRPTAGGDAGTAAASGTDAHV
jgi:pimeloyl-ACP methyl ester carboxylesterase